MTRTYRSILELHFEQRKEVNPLYSLNAFARDLGLTPSHLSGILNGKKGMSAVTADKVARKLRLPREDRKAFIHMVTAASARSLFERKKAATKLAGSNGKYHELSSPMFIIIKDWYHFALIEYVRITKKNFSISKASQYFKVRPSELKLAFRRLLDSGLVVGKRFYRPAYQNYTTPIGIPMAAKKLHHLQLLNRAQVACLEHDFESKDFRANIIAVNPDRLDESRQIILECHQKLEKLMGDPNDNLSEVYCFSSQLFSLKGVRND